MSWKIWFKGNCCFSLVVYPARDARDSLFTISVPLWLTLSPFLSSPSPLLPTLRNKVSPTSTETAEPLWAAAATTPLMASSTMAPCALQQVTAQSGWPLTVCPVIAIRETRCVWRKTAARSKKNEAMTSLVTGSSKKTLRVQQTQRGDEGDVCCWPRQFINLLNTDAGLLSVTLKWSVLYLNGIRLKT